MVSPLPVFFYNLEMEAPAAVEFSYSDAHRAAYEEPTELTALAQLDTHPKWRKWMGRIVAIRNIPRTWVFYVERIHVFISIELTFHFGRINCQVCAIHAPWLTAPRHCRCAPGPYDAQICACGVHTCFVIFVIATFTLSLHTRPHPTHEPHATFHP